MTDEEKTNRQTSRKGDALEQLVSVAISGSSVWTAPGTDPGDLSDDN